MARILGIIGSARRWGNSELLVRQALRGAQAQESGVQMIRLTDLHLAPCTGCMRCVIGGKPCPVDDDVAWLAEAIRGADGLVLAAPTYFLGPAAVIKLVLDRLMMVTGKVNAPLPALRPAITIATAGLADWRGVTLPYLNALAAAFGYLPIESLTAVAPGPGEVLLDEGLMERVLEAGRRLGRGELEPSPVPPGICPICRCDAFVLDGKHATCPICGLRAEIRPDRDRLRLRFETDPTTDHRWTPEGLRKHMVDWVMATGPRYMARRSEIKSRRSSHRKFDIDWLCPPSQE